jgi:hypothetical protein
MRFWENWLNDRDNSVVCSCECDNNSYRSYRINEMNYHFENSFTCVTMRFFICTNKRDQVHWDEVVFFFCSERPSAENSYWSNWSARQITWYMCNVNNIFHSCRKTERKRTHSRASIAACDHIENVYSPEYNLVIFLVINIVPINICDFYLS